MIGERIVSRRRIPWDALLFLLAGLWLIGKAVAESSAEMAIVAVLPLAWSAAYWWARRERPFAATFQAAGIAVEDPPAFIPYASLCDVRVNHQSLDPAQFRKATGAIQVRHEAGMLYIPRRLSVPSHEVYRFLSNRVRADGGRDVNPTLIYYRDRQEHDFGPDQVWTFRDERLAAARRLFAFQGLWHRSVVDRSGLDSPRLLGPLPDDLGRVGCVLRDHRRGVLWGRLAPGAASNCGVEDWAKASIVLGTQGMAVAQGGVQGELSWPELLESSIRPPRRPFTLADGEAWQLIRLRTKGGDIVLPDIYDRPLYLIHEQIQALSGRSDPIDLEV